jgi:hypothetical protein
VGRRRPKVAVVASAFCIASSRLAGGGCMILHIDVGKTVDEYHEIPCLMILNSRVALVADTYGFWDANTLLTSKLFST